MITERQFISKIEQHNAFYLFFKAGRPFEKVSLVESGNNKSLNQIGIYDGGWVVAFGLDILIRKITDNKLTSENYMNELYKKFAILTEMTNKDFTDFYEKYINGL